MRNIFARRGEPAVSIIIATYNTGERLGPVVESLDGLEMRSGELEVIFIDDGSTDGTFDELTRICSSRSSFSVERIPNSGWPSRPRNVGVAKARGEYVFFMDHDDYIFPDGLPAALEFARTNDLDYVSTKEVVAGWSSPGWSCFRANIPIVEGMRDEAVQCITPHKLYRREFLLANELTFPEEIKRLEDFNLNGRVFAAGARAGVFAARPVYRWELYDGNSHKSGYNVQEYWKSIDESLAAVLSIEDRDKREVLLMRWYRTLVLERVGTLLLKRTARGRDELMQMLAERLEWFPESLHARMSPLERARSIALHSGSVPALIELAHFTRDMKLVSRHTHAAWQGGKVLISCDAVVATDEGRTLAVDGGEEDPAFLFPPTTARVLGQSRMPMGADLKRAIPELVIRHRESNVDWTLPSTGAVTVREENGVEVLSVSIEATLDPERTPFGDKLLPGIYDIFHRVDKLGFAPTSRLRALQVSDVVIADGPSPFNVYTTTAGFLAMDTTAQARPSAERVTSSGWTSGARLD